MPNKLSKSSYSQSVDHLLCHCANIVYTYINEKASVSLEAFSYDRIPKWHPWGNLVVNEVPAWSMVSFGHLSRSAFGGQEKCLHNRNYNTA